VNTKESKTIVEESESSGLKKREREREVRRSIVFVEKCINNNGF
jgi:hypothetical protein